MSGEHGMERIEELWVMLCEQLHTSTLAGVTASATSSAPKHQPVLSESK